MNVIASTDDNAAPLARALTSLKLIYVGIFVFVVTFWRAVAWGAWSFVRQGAQL